MNSQKTAFVPDDFCWRSYLRLYPELLRAGIDTEEKAREHWLRHGLAQGAAYRIDHYSTALELMKAQMPRISPLNLAVSPSAPRRINMLIESTNDLFGGYISTYYLVRKLQEWGFRMRLVTLRHFPSFLNRQAELDRWPGLENFLETVDSADCSKRSTPLEVSPDDRFIARSSWSAHVAHEAAARLGKKRFIFLTQDFEPGFYPRNYEYALAVQAYQLPQYTLYSTDFLRDYIRKNQDIAPGREERKSSAVFYNAIPRFEVTRETMTARRPRRLLFYARPVMLRNLFETGLLALRQAVQAGRFTPPEWEIHAIGNSETPSSFELFRGFNVKILPLMKLEDYLRLLPGYDVGLSLMLSPHPSLVPLDMAAAGMLAVTNTYANKTASALRRISPNLIPVSPDIASVRDGLFAALGRAGDYEGRLAGARLKWPRTWDEAFPPRLKKTLLKWLD